MYLRTCECIGCDCTLHLPKYVSAMEYRECCVHMCRLQSAQAELNKVMAQLKEKQEKLAAIEAKVKPAAPCACAYTQIQYWCTVLIGGTRVLCTLICIRRKLLHTCSLSPFFPHILTPLPVSLSLSLLPHLSLLSLSYLTCLSSPSPLSPVSPPPRLSLLSLPSLPPQIADLQASYERSVAEKEELTRNIEKTQARLDRAAKLTTGLADEQIRWAESVKVSLHPLQGGREFYC